MRALPPELLADPIWRREAARLRRIVPADRWRLTVDWQLAPGDEQPVELVISAFKPRSRRSLLERLLGASK